MKKDKKQYEAPSLTAVSFKTERGYAASGIAALVDFNFWQESEGSEQIESYTTVTGWDQGSNNFWD